MEIHTRYSYSLLLYPTPSAAAAPALLSLLSDGWMSSNRRSIARYIRPRSSPSAIAAAAALLLPPLFFAGVLLPAVKAEEAA